MRKFIELFFVFKLSLQKKLLKAMNQTLSTTPNEWQKLSSWVLLTLVSGLGPVSGRQLLDEFGTPEYIFAASESVLAETVSGKLLHSLLAAPSDVTLQHRLQITAQWLKAHPSHYIITLNDPLYPQALKVLPDAPLLLYVVGDASLLNEPQIAIVGSRRPTIYGYQCAHRFAEQLVRNGIVITSGMALGIDAAAHQGTISVQGKTIAVLGTGVDQIYPSRHRDLYHTIAQQGLLVSEFPLGTKPFAGNFPKRNRIITGLSLGVLVVEAAVESGSLISARLAAEQGREVFAIPGSTANPLSRGCHRLLRDGAVLVESVDDIMIELSPQLQSVVQPSSGDTEIDLSYLEPQQKMIIEAIGFEVVDPDVLSRRVGISIAELSVALTELELEGLIEAIPGGVVCLK